MGGGVKSNHARIAGADKKRPCLKCDRLIYTTPERRICDHCADDNERLINSWALPNNKQIDDSDLIRAFGRRIKTPTA